MASESEDEKVHITVQMPEQLRTDANDATTHGELSAAVRNLYREKAYGDDAELEPERAREVPIDD